MARIKKRTNYVFTYGASAAGKSTVLASVCRHLLLHPHKNLEPNPATLDGQGGQLYLRWMKRLMSKQFPEVSEKNIIKEVEVALVSDQDRIPFTFLDMAGKDLMIFEKCSSTQIPDKEMELTKQLVAFLKAARVILLVSSVDKAREDDVNIYKFLNTVSRVNPSADVVLLISKWDKSSYADVQEFVRCEMAITYAQYQKGTVEIDSILSFQVGKVEARVIRELQDADSEQLVNWIYNRLLMAKVAKKGIEGTGIIQSSSSS